MDDPYADAFKDDKREAELFGENVFSESSQFDFTTVSSIPESKCNNVSFMKVDSLPKELRNLLAVSESFICYAVTTKRNLLRLINTITGDKVILRGHEGAVIDLKFSPTDSGMLCSIDKGDTAGVPHILIWQKDESSNALNFKNIAQLSIQAKFLVPHPSQSHVWLFADDNHVGLFSTKSSTAPNSYSDLASRLEIMTSDGTICGVAFTADGRALSVAVRHPSSGATSLQVWRIGSASSDLAALASKPMTPANLSGAIQLQDFLAIKFVGNYLVVVCRNSTNTGSSKVSYTVGIYQCSGDRFDMDLVQTITIYMPKFKSSLAAPPSFVPHLEVSLCDDGSQASKCLILSSRLSHIVACLAVNPSVNSTSPSGSCRMPLFHVTFLNLKAPVVSMDVTTILGREHHSAEEGEHIEMSCYQEEASDQASVLQYHALCENLFNYAKYTESKHSVVNESAGRLGSSSGSSGNTGKSGTLLGLLKSSSASLASPTAGVAAAGTSPGLRWPEEKPVSDSGSGKALLASTAKRDESAAAPDTAGLSSFLNAQSTKNVSLLSMVSSSSVDSTSTPSKPSPAAAAAPAAVAKASEEKTKPAAAASATTATTPSPAAKEVKGKKLVSMLNPKSSGSNSSLSSMTMGADSTDRPSGCLQMLLFDTCTAPRCPHSHEAHVLALTHQYYQRMLGMSKYQAAGAAAEAPSTPMSTNSIEQNGTPAHMVSSLAEIKQVVRGLAKSNVTKEHVAKLQEQVVMVADGVGKTAAQQNDVAKAMEKHTRALEALRGAVDSSNKEGIKSALAAPQFKKELGTAVADQLQKDLVTQLSQRLQESLKDAVKDTLKSSLGNAFRTSFESTVIPAFQTGTDRMFSQIQSSFEHGMEGLVQESKKVAVVAESNSKNLEDEVLMLKQTVKTLETTVVELSISHSEAMRAADRRAEQLEALVRSQVQILAKLESDGFRSTVGSAAGCTVGIGAPAEKPKETPDTLIAKGMIQEAVVLALEMKDISVMVSVLDMVTPTAVNSKCTSLIRLCIAQQLAADMSSAIPEEGVAKRIEWIKSLVLSLVNSPPNEKDQKDLAAYERNFKAMIQVVLQSLQAAKELIFSSTTEGEVPMSVGTDLQMLEFIIQMKL